jgi:hypothetical protein
MATTTPNYGWSVPTSTDYVKDGATAIETLGDAIDATSAGANLAGLVLVKTQTIGSAVSSVSVSSAFSTTYDNYLIKVSGGVASIANEFILQLNGITTNVYYSGLLYGSYSGSSPLWAGNNGASSFQWCGSNSTSTLDSHIELDSPFLAKGKTYRAGIAQHIAGSSGGRSQGFCDSTASATGFTLAVNTGTITGGTVYVYGYRKAV